MEIELPNIKITEATENLMKEALEILNNKNNLITIDFNEFCRLCYETSSRLILRDGELPVVLE